MKRRAAARRSGISLSELLVVCSLVAILLPMSGKLLWTLANINREASLQFDERRSLSALFIQMKADSLGSKMQSNDDELRFVTTDNKIITYRSSENAVTRLSTLSDAVSHREDYRARGLTFRVRLDPETKAQSIVEVSIQRGDVDRRDYQLTLPVSMDVSELQP